MPAKVNTDKDNGPEFTAEEEVILDQEDDKDTKVNKKAVYADYVKGDSPAVVALKHGVEAQEVVDIIDDFQAKETKKG